MTPTQSADRTLPTSRPGGRTLSAEERQQEFERREAERDRIFQENEAARAARAAGIPYDPEEQAPTEDGEVTPGRVSGSGRGPSVRRSRTHRSDEPMTGVDIESVNADSSRALFNDMMDQIQQSREERLAADEERAQLHAQLEDARLEREAERDAKIAALEDELAQVKEELENEKQQRMQEDADTRERERQEALERDEGVREQLSDITNIVQAQRDEDERLAQEAEARFQDKITRQEAKDAQMSNLVDMVQQMMDDREAEKIRAEEERIANEGKPGLSILFDQH